MGLHNTYQQVINGISFHGLRYIAEIVKFFD